MSVDARYAAFFLGSRSHVPELELLELVHPAFSKTWRLVRNAINGVTVTLETSVSATFDYCPMRITRADVTDDLDYGLTIELGDLGEILPNELDLVADADGFGDMPAMIFRTYRADDLAAPLFGPVDLRVKSFSMTREGASFTAQAPTIASAATGELYRLDRFPMLRGFL